MKKVLMCCGAFVNQRHLNPAVHKHDKKSLTLVAHFFNASSQTRGLLYYPHSRTFPARSFVFLELSLLRQRSSRLLGGQMISSSNPPRQKPSFLQRIKVACLDVRTRHGKSRHHVVYGSHVMKGKSSRPMEDHIVCEIKCLKEHDVGLFAVFDGHLGHEVSCYLQANLFNNILNQPAFWTDPSSAITNGYLQTDATILLKSAELGTGGSTALTAIVIDGASVYVANVGDSRAVICRAGVATPITVDHDPISERSSVQSKGGYITVLPGDVPRVNGQLAVARAFGDKNLKAHLRSDPDVYCLLIQKTDEFLILASDGLWKVIENQVAVDLVRRTKDPKAAAKQLVDYAIRENSKDDISCVVVRFH
ncbi:hypothetical protein GOP47_0025555 [Adiantum capillus-veneris]|uniref:protein-serine/threonine phosphatase n=1 Tax=Adiantum capillus-veneris TaxID=13818 RepID=A0A9D4U2Y8_ADICA|nr:hypothetical protein GOP47_0025555 [Adiantum capillus-veneris]